MKFWKCLRVHAICNLYLCICYNFALVWHENSLVFSQLDSCNCFLYIIMKIIMSENKHLVIYTIGILYKTLTFLMIVTTQMSTLS